MIIKNNDKNNRSMDSCPLCQGNGCMMFSSDKHRDYRQCGECDMVFVPEKFHLTLEKEKERYNLHTNIIHDDGYVAYLKMALEYIKKIPCVNPTILDFGSGKNAVLTDIVRTEGFSCTPFDPLYGIGLDALNHGYDIVVLWEVIEHVRDIGRLIDLLQKAVKPSGYCIIRTQLVRPDIDFPLWWYKQDLTHIRFFSQRTLLVFASRLNRSILLNDTINTIVIGPGKNY